MTDKSRGGVDDWLNDKADENGFETVGRYRWTGDHPPTGGSGISRPRVDSEPRVGYTGGMETSEHIDALINRCVKAESALAQISVEMGPLTGVPDQTYVDDEDAVVQVFDAIKGRTARIRTILRDAGFPPPTDKDNS